MITQFKGKYDFLDPAYYCLAEYDGVIYNSAEAAFVASQYDDPYFRSMFSNSSLPIWRARELSKRLQKRRDWTPELSLDLTRQITLDKFSPLPKSPLTAPGYARRADRSGEQLARAILGTLHLQHSTGQIRTERCLPCAGQQSPWKDSNVCKRPAHRGSAGRIEQHLLLEKLPH